MSYMDPQGENTDSITSIQNIMYRIHEIDRTTTQLAQEKASLQKKLDQLRQQVFNVNLHSFQNGRTYFDEYDNCQQGYLNNGIDNYNDYQNNNIYQYPSYNRVQNLNQNINNNINSLYYSNDQAVLNDQVDDYFDTDFNQKMYYEQPKHVSNEKFSSFNNMNQENIIMENNAILGKEDLIKPFINNQNENLGQELSLNTDNQLLIENQKSIINNPISNENMQQSLCQNDSQNVSKMPTEFFQIQEQTIALNDNNALSKYNNSIMEIVDKPSKQQSLEINFEGQDRNENQKNPQNTDQLYISNKQTDTPLLQTPQQNIECFLDQEKQSNSKKKGVSGFNKIKKEKNKHFKKNSATETIKLCKYNQSQNKKTKCFTKELSQTSQECQSQFENNFLHSIQNLNHDELMSNNKSCLNTHFQTNNYFPEEKINDKQQAQSKTKEDPIEKEKQMFLSQKKKYIETVTEDSLKSQFAKQLHYLQEINLGKITTDENNNQMMSEEQFENSEKKSQNSESDQKLNSNSSQFTLELKLRESDIDANEKRDKIENIKRLYRRFLNYFYKNKNKFARGKGFYRYPSALKVRIVEFSKYIKLINIQKDTQISQETIRKWQKRYL